MSDIPMDLKGFLFSFANAKIKESGKPDLGLIFSTVKATAAAVFTKNAIKAAPVYISIDKLKSGFCQGVIVNSGNANAATGEEGLADAKSMAFYAAKCLNLDEDDVVVASTGVIGKRLEIKKIKGALPALCHSLAPDRIVDFAESIMTTDTFHKISHRAIQHGDNKVVVCGIAKGAGMIMPNMATMLGFILTDAAVEHRYLDEILRQCVDKTFNRITVDGDTSTNDMVLIMANGESGAANITKGSDEAAAFVDAVQAVMYDLSEMIVKDGEGATKLLKVITTGAKSAKDAENVSRTIAN